MRRTVAPTLLFVVALSALPSCGLVATFDRTKVEEDAGPIDLLPPDDVAPGDARLASLSLDVAPLVPGFQPNQTSYGATYRMLSAYETFDERPVRVVAVPFDPFADVQVVGAVSQVRPGETASVFLRSSRHELGVAVVAGDRRDSRYYRVELDVRVSDYLKASNPRSEARFGSALAIEGTTLVVGAREESSRATGVNGDQSDTSLPGAGAAYVFVRTGSTWAQQAYLKGSSFAPGEGFGTAVAISGDTIAVGAPGELANAGAVHLFRRSGTTWSEQGVLRASNVRGDDPLYGKGARFGASLALSGDELVVGAPEEPSAAFGIDGDATSVSAPGAGAVYTFTRTGGVFTQRAYVKSIHTAAGSRFGAAVAYATGTVAIGSEVGPTPARGGAVYLFTKTGSSLAYGSFVQPTNASRDALFGTAVALSPNGAILAVGAEREASRALGIDGDATDTTADSAGAAYLFTRSGSSWAQRTYVKPSNTRPGMHFGHAVAMRNDTLVVGAWGESSNATGFNGNETNFTMPSAGATYVFRLGSTWTQSKYVKASNPGNVAFFGDAVAATDTVLVVGALGEKGSSKGVNGPESAASLFFAGAVYVY
ncbi:MAG: hypothetical protein JST00_25615 [Deltaproteobacteria bacterium]|nr:hypothetical protein [Deltaproteobacteria bacterium]